MSNMADIVGAIVKLQEMNFTGGCYSLIHDDFGNWACVSDGIQPAEERFDGATTFLVEKDDWSKTIEGAIWKAARKRNKWPFPPKNVPA